MFSQKQTRVWMNREMSSRHDVVGDGPRAVPSVILLSSMTSKELLL